MFQVRRVDAAPLAVMTWEGVVTGPQVMAEIERAYAKGDLEPGLARLVVMRGDDRLMDANDLAAIRRLIARHEGCRSQGRLYSSVMLAMNDRMAVMAEIYISLWDLHGGCAAPHFELVRSADMADRVLAARMPEVEAGLALKLAG